MSFEEYRNSMNIAESGSPAQRDLVEEVKKRIDLKMIQTGSFLDVGAGPGTITKQIAPLFTSTIIIEPQHHFAEMYRLMGFETYEMSFEDFEYHGHFDFILISHVLYNVQFEKWIEWIKRLTSFLSEDGVLLIAQDHGDDTTKFEFLHHFFPDKPVSLHEVSDVRKFEREFIYHKYTHKLETRQEMIQLLNFMVYGNQLDKNSMKEEELKDVDYVIDEFVDNRLYFKDSNIYVLDWRQEMVFLYRKKSVDITLLIDEEL